MALYAIDDEHGNLLTEGLAEHEARDVAQRAANRLKANVYLYPYEEDGDDGELEEFVPQEAE